MSYFRAKSAVAYHSAHHRKKFRDFADTALIVVDVQRRYADPAFQERGSLKTHRTAQRIAKYLPKIRALGIQIYFAYLFRKEMQEVSHLPDTCCGGFHLVRPMSDEVLIPKTGASAITSSDLKNRLLSAGHRDLIVVGFNSSACIKFTAFDAKQQGFNVTVLEDLVENDKENNKPKMVRLKTLRDKGIRVLPSHEIYQQLCLQRN